MIQAMALGRTGRRRGVAAAAGLASLALSVPLLLGEAPFLGGLTLVLSVFGLVLFWRGNLRVLGGALAVGSMGVASQAEWFFHGNSSRFTFAGGAVVLGWILGISLYRKCMGNDSTLQDSIAGEEAFGERGALGVLAVIYVNSGLSKGFASLWTWMDSENLAAVVTAHTALSPFGDGASWVAWVVATPAATAALAWVTFVLEVGAFCLLFGSRIRFVWAFGLLGMHMGIGLLSGSIWYVVNMLLLVVFATSRNDEEPLPPFESKHRVPALRWAAILFGMGWLFIRVIQGVFTTLLG